MVVKRTPPSEPCISIHPLAFVKRVVKRCACMLNDVDAVVAHDPAASGRLEVIFTYPGLHALWLHRMAHYWWRGGFFGVKLQFLPRFVAFMARFLTGIEIHPGARIGQKVFIDHGMGVVIGETASVGDGCLIYKGVVLGGTSLNKGIRHPQLGAHVVVGSNACVLGNIDIGDGARIGSGSVVIRSVEEGATVVGVPGRVIRAGDKRTQFDLTLDHASLPDPVSEMLRQLRDENECLKQRLVALEAKAGIAQVECDELALVDPLLATSDLPPAQHGG